MDTHKQHAIIVGSNALNFQMTRNDKISDTDYIMTWETYKTFLKVLKAKTDNKILSVYPYNEGRYMIVKTSNMIYEIEIAWDNSTSSEFMKNVLLESHADEILIDDISGITFHYASLPALYAMKMSHRFLKNSPHFKKTMRHILDIRKFNSSCNYPFSNMSNPDIEGKWQFWYERRMKETLDYAHPSLDASKSDFFDKNETFYQYDHDTIHKAVKVGSEPAYKKIIEDGCDVKCSKGKWNKLKRYDKILCGLEESYVLALERYLIPNKFTSDRFEAFEIALEKVCTSITSGWFRDFCYDNYQDIISLYHPDYVARFKLALESGNILPFSVDRES